MSALQIFRVLGFGSYKTAWSMCHRIRAGMADENFQQLLGVVEVDETYVGGKAKNRAFEDLKQITDRRVFFYCDVSYEDIYRSGISFVVFSNIFIDSALRLFHSRSSASFCESLA